MSSAAPSASSSSERWSFQRAACSSGSAPVSPSTHASQPLSIEPLVDAPVGLVLRLGEPADEERRVAVVGQRARRARDDARRELVGRQAAVAVLPLRLGRDHVGRVARDQVERVAGDRLEQAAEARLDVVEPVQRGVDRGERERAWVHVRCDHVIAVTRGQQRVHAVAGPHVERTPAPRPRGERRAPRRGRCEGGDVARRVVGAAREGVAREQKALGRHDPALRLDQLCVAPREPERDQRADAVLAECVCQIPVGHRKLQQEQPHDGRELRRRQPPVEDDDVLGVGPGPVVAEQLDDVPLVVADGL